MNIVAGERSILEVPKEFAARITRAGGRNRFGGPMYRVVWGWSRMGWFGYQGAVWREPQYLDRDRWILEKWVSPESYGSPQNWARQFADLGPYPSRGDYEMVTDFPPMELNSKVADYLVNVIERSAAASSGERRAALEAREERKRAEQDRIDDDILEDGMRAFYGAPHVALSS